MRIIFSGLTMLSLLLAIAIILPCMLIGRLAWVRHLPSEWRLLRRMKRSGRHISFDAAADACSAGHGTAIFELPSLTISRLWWTEDEIFRPPNYSTLDKIEPIPSIGFDQWLYERYLAPDVGKALIVRVGKLDTSVICPGGKFAAQGCNVVTIATGSLRRTQ